MLGLVDPVIALDFDNAAALALIRHENAAVERAKGETPEMLTMPDALTMDDWQPPQASTEIVPGQPFVSVVQI